MDKNVIIKEQRKLTEELKREADDLIERMSELPLKDRLMYHYEYIEKVRSEIREYVNMDFNKACDDLIDQARRNPKETLNKIILGCQTKLILKFDLESYYYLRKLDELLTKE